MARSPKPPKKPGETIVPEIYAHRIVRTLHLRIDDQPGRLGAVASAVGKAGGLIGDVTRDWVDTAHVYRRITVYVQDERHLEKVLSDIRAVGGVDVLEVVDDVLRIHEGGKIEISSRLHLSSMEDLQKVYTPGVASVSKKIQADPSLARKYNLGVGGR